MAAILTLDAGTSGLKCSLFQFDGTLLGAYVAEYPTLYPREGWAEQRAEDIIRAAVESVNVLMQKFSAEDICAIGLTGTMSGCIPLDKDGNALRPNIIHLDTRATEQVAQLEERMGRKAFYEHTGNRPDVHYGLEKLMWIRENEPEIYKKTCACVNTKDIIYGFLTGRCGCTDYSDASLFGALNIHTRKWDEDVCAAAQVDINRLAELHSSTDVSVGLSKKAASLLGLKAGIPVTVGAGDGPCTTHGSGASRNNDVYLTVGSSAWICGLSNIPRIDPEMRSFNYTDMDENLVDICGTVQCAATAYDYMMTTVLNLTAPSGKIDYARAEALSDESATGAHGLFFLPTLMGERCPWWDVSARGMLVGLTLTHTRADMSRAVYEGIAQALHNCGDVLRENGIPIDSLILSGGGVKSSVWPQMFADIFASPTKVHANPREATSLGAAIAAGVGVKVFSSFEEASKIVHTRAMYTPDPERVKAYARHTQVYRALYGQMKEAMHAIHDYQQSC